MAADDPLISQLDPSIRDHVAKMMEDAKSKYKCVMRINQTKRTREQAQTFHVLHMYLYNYFPNRKPKFVAADGRTILWDHLADPGISWELIDDSKGAFLRTAKGTAATLQVDDQGKKRWVEPPEQAASGKAMAKYLKSHGVSSMAAPGKDGCGEPCLCGGHASKHVTGKAADLSGMQELGSKILAAEPGKYKTADEAVDHFLNTYQLWRPLAHLKGKARELWHVELLPPHHAAHAKSSHKDKTPHSHPHGHHRGHGGC
jgi:hypothetical protein